MINAKLKKELLLLAKRDQEVRREGNWNRKIDERSTRRLKKIIKLRGWPTISIVGKEASHAAWLIVQHSPDLKFQKECLGLLRKAVAANESLKADLAYLIDRIKIKDSKKQLFGTQFKFNVKTNKLIPYPIQNPKFMDKRRKAYGLEKFSTYQKKMQRGNLATLKRLMKKFSETKHKKPPEKI